MRQMFRLALPEAEEEVIHALEQQFRMAYDRDGWTRTVVFPGVLETLDELKTLGVRCFGVTNKPGEVTQKVLGHCRLVGRFEGFISPDSSQPAFSSKADATRWLLAENQIDPHTACFVGDTVEDARAAQACGMRFIAFSCGYGWSGLRTQMGGLVSFSEFSALAGLLRDRYWSE